MVTLATASDLAQEALCFFNQGNKDRLAGLLANEVELTYMLGRSVVRSREEIIDHIWTLRRAYPDMRGETTRMVPGDHEVCLEITWSGTHQGDLDTPIGVFTPTGRRCEVHGCLIVHTNGDQIVGLTHYCEAGNTFIKLGLIPGWEKALL